MSPGTLSLLGSKTCTVPVWDNDVSRHLLEGLGEEMDYQHPQGS